ncbi:MAG TPA: type I glyceraldehyde-3-phosphate dehydrogenase [Candidatus Hydrogenedentes bacterium]|jgi:glyceraldehyde 3-phosphate dehydrogenase|nr:MAG: Glyceraldehyde-3-phosphate dehydrogenase [Candidatus Hydrogenedentes bacterium ADurb.Bin170]HNZ47408.1 type I glyceraldehyde-3-phosphate dehydrogenase [Candidatus Hydrogenedentota bacterium]HOD94208.1 type I glyceraldehyde-3-phosphate dehydrogenase [Candidatus Hydrogenedentota bacterium]HOH42690.1 type I glyceraldehyde-3-phosphate dehydrogenase [Candidatus Hydrogenedentota bacterium]HOM47054.1 type I glyceraldehyde-3-phosphate dehydrogenase [Candidatus Hydrogenedentota bacterium]
MATKVGINGFGRIGRNVFKLLLADPAFEVVAINDLTNAKTLAHLLKYDSVHGVYGKEVSAKDDAIVVDGKEIKVLAVRNPADLPWGELGVELVLESTGIFRSKEQCNMHIQAGAKKVLLSVPPKDAIDAVIVVGVNDDTLKSTDCIVSNASCTTNCLAPVAKVLHENFGIKRGLMTTIHAYTNDQAVLDLPHSDLRRARAAAHSIIPTSTGAARAVGQVLPALNGKLDGMAMRVPVINGSVVDLVAELEKPATKDEINAAIKAAAEGALKGVLQYTADPIVSCDIIGNPHSSIFDSLETTVMGGDFIKIVSWYDNEWGYSNRCLDLFKMMAS